jgi:hypothetical protein
VPEAILFAIAAKKIHLLPRLAIRPGLIAGATGAGRKR